MELPTSSQAGRKSAHPPVSQSRIMGGVGNLPLQPGLPSPWSEPGPLMYPTGISHRPCVCVPVCACPLEEAGVYPVTAGGCFVWRGPSVWCCPGVLGPAMVWGCSPHPPPLPAQLLWVPCMPKPVGKAVHRAGGIPSALVGPPLRPPQGLWVGSNERVRDAQGNTGLGCLLDASSALQGGTWRHQEPGVLLPTLLLSGSLLLRRELSSPFWLFGGTPTTWSLSFFLS